MPLASEDNLAGRQDSHQATRHSRSNLIGAPWQGHMAMSYQMCLNLFFSVEQGGIGRIVLSAAALIWYFLGLGDMMHFGD